jgi:hypothetical protein
LYLLVIYPFFVGAVSDARGREGKMLAGNKKLAGEWRRILSQRGSVTDP